ncbi:MAG: hypothetical protein QOC99_1151, partial [Acidobacteriota bacterium]|nr:hypothetical protein [Acidobacteriota bacterium]
MRTTFTLLQPTRPTYTLLLVVLFALSPVSAAFAQKRGTTPRQPATPKTTMPTSNKPATVLEPTASPLVSFRLLFMTGAASDP